MDFVGDAGFKIERAVSESWHVDCGRSHEGAKYSGYGTCTMRPISGALPAGTKKADTYLGPVVELAHFDELPGTWLTIKFARDVPIGSRMRIATKDTVLSKIAVPGVGGEVWINDSARRITRQFIRGDTATWSLTLPSGGEQTGTFSLKGFAAALEFCARRLNVDPFAPSFDELKGRE